MRSRIFLFFGAFFLFSNLPGLNAWGALTHMGLSLKAGEKANLPVSVEYLGPFLAGATEPDIGAMSGDMTGVSDSYHIYHDPQFVVAMTNVAKRLKSPYREKLLARALGFQAHKIGDGVAHTVTGYPNRKEVYFTLKVRENKIVHITTELCLDLLTYYQFRKKLDKIRPEFIDLNTLIAVREEYGRITGKTIPNDRKKLQKDILMHRAIPETEKSIAKKLIKTKPWIFKELDGFFSDRVKGLTGKAGFKLTIERLVEFYRDCGPQIKKEKDQRKIREKARDALKRVFDVVSEATLGQVEKLTFTLVNQEAVFSRTKSLLADKLKAENHRILVGFVMNLLQKRMGFREAIFYAENPLFRGQPTREEKISLLTAEKSILYQKVKRAYEEYKNRPGWKVWLRITNSDKKRFEQARSEYRRCVRELNSLKKNSPTGQPSFSAGTPMSGAQRAVFDGFVNHHIGVIEKKIRELEINRHQSSILDLLGKAELSKTITRLEAQALHLAAIRDFKRNRYLKLDKMSLALVPQFYLETMKNGKTEMERAAAHLLLKQLAEQLVTLTPGERGLLFDKNLVQDIARQLQSSLPELAEKLGIEEKDLKTEGESNTPAESGDTSEAAITEMKVESPLAVQQPRTSNWSRKTFNKLKALKEKYIRQLKSGNLKNGRSRLYLERYRSLKQQVQPNP